MDEMRGFLHRSIEAGKKLPPLPELESGEYAEFWDGMSKEERVDALAIWGAQIEKRKKQEEAWLTPIMAVVKKPFEELQEEVIGGIQLTHRDYQDLCVLVRVKNEESIFKHFGLSLKEAQRIVRVCEQKGY